MLQFVLGTADSGKTQWIYDDIENRLKNNEKSWILVPEQFSLFTEKEILRRFGLPAQVHIKVLSFSGLCNMVLQRSGPLRMRYIDGAGKHIIAAQAMESLKGKLSALSGNLRQKGFTTVLVDTISEFKRYGVPPQVLRFAADNTDMPDLSAKLLDLSLLYETYNNLLENRNADAEDNLSLICPRLRQCEYLTGKMYVMYFRSFTPVEHKALGELMHRLDLCVAMNYSNAPEFAGLFSPVGGTVRRIKETAEKEGIPEAEDVIMPVPKGDSPLAYLKNRYFDPKAEPFNADCENIKIYEVQNHYREVECAADLILKLCRTENLRFNDFLILARETDKYNRIMPGIFERRGIHVFLDTRRSVASKPLIRLISNMLDIIARGCSYERVMAAARTGLFDLTDDEIDIFENYILAVAPSHAMWQSESWDYVPGHGNYDMEKVNHARQVILSGVNEISGRISGTKTGGEIASSVLEWMKKSGLSVQVSQRIKECTENNMPELADEYQQVWNTAISVLSQISAVMKDTQMTWLRFAELFKESVSGIEIGLTPQTLDSVTFGKIDRFRSSGSKVVIVLGMNEGVFPKGHTTEGLISDAERMKLNSMGIELAPGMESKRREEQLLIYAVLSAAREKMFMFKPISDNAAKLLQPSGILKRVEELLPQIATVNPDTDGDALGGAEGENAAFDILAAALAEAGGRPESLSEPLRELYRYFSKSDMLKQIHGAMNAKPPEKLSLDMAESIYGKPLSLSASQLETYNSCAFKYFLTYGLMLREREKAGAEPRSMGNVQHAALYDYFTELKSMEVDFDNVTKDDCFNMVSGFVEKEAKENAELLYESSAYFRYIVMRMKGIASRTAWEVVKFYKSSAFKPYGFEIKIGLKGEIPTLNVLDDKGERIAGIRGIIDRADTAEAGGKTLVNVIDYKSSSKDLDVTLTQDGITLQPLLYADAICKKIPNAEPAALVYMQMNDPIIDEGKAKKGVDAAVNKLMTPKGWIADDAAVLSAYTRNESEETGSFVPSGATAKVDADELKKRMERANEKIRESALNIADGIIGANPYQTNKHDACQYCPYGSVCKKEN